jgi:hypothetical protein
MGILENGCSCGMAYFLVSKQHHVMGNIIVMDSIALFDFFTKEWRPETLNGQLI